MRALLGAPRGEVQHELADAVAVGDARGAFEVVDRLVQDGQDLRNVTGGVARRTSATCCSSRPRPARQDLIDVPGRRVRRRCAIQAEKFTPGELARVIVPAAGRPERHALDDLAAALARARARARDDPRDRPDAPPALVARLERLERLANLDAGRSCRRPSAAHAAPPSPADDVEAVPAAVEAPIRSPKRECRPRRRVGSSGQPSRSRPPEPEAADGSPASLPSPSRRPSPQVRRPRCRSRTRPTPAASTSRCSGGPGPR